jgi:hypothetical protein
MFSASSQTLIEDPNATATASSEMPASVQATKIDSKYVG